MFNADYSRARVPRKYMNFTLAVALDLSRRKTLRQMSRKGKYDCCGPAIRTGRWNEIIQLDRIRNLKL